MTASSASESRPPGRHRRECGTVRRDDRGLSFTVNYVLTIAIAVLLVAGILLAAGGVVRDQRGQTIRDGATVVADETATAVMEADRLARIGTATHVSVALTPPERIGGTPYVVALETSGSSTTVVVRTRSPSIAARVPLATETSVRPTNVTGGSVQVVYNPDTDDLRLTEGTA